MDASPPDVEELVERRARELRAEGLRYAAAVSALAQELYLHERGKETRLGAMGLARGVLHPLLRGANLGESLFSKSKKGKAQTIGALETLISAWVAGIYEKASP